MLLIYLDESYKRQRDYWLAACAVHDEEVAEMCAGVRSAAARIPSEFDIPEAVELHAQHLYHGTGEFAAMKRAVRARVQTYRRGLEALCATGPALFFVGVAWNDVLGPAHRLSSHRLAAMRHLLPEIERHCEQRGERCLIVADEEDTTTEEVVAVVREHQSDLAAAGESSRVLDTPLFTQSHHSHGVQACDLAAFLHARRRFARPDEDARAKKVQDDWWDLVSPHIAMEVCHTAPSQLDALFAEEMAETA